MASLAVPGTSGEGNQPLGGSRTVTHVTAHLITGNPAQTRYVGNMYPRGVWHVGTVGLGDFPGDGSGVTLAIELGDWFLHYENEVLWVPQKPIVVASASSVFWRWLPGVTVDLEVFW